MYPLFAHKADRRGLGGEMGERTKAGGKRGTSFRVCLPESHGLIEPAFRNGARAQAKAMRQAICQQMGFDSLGYQSLDGLLEAIGLDRSKVCTYCWTGEE